MESVPLMTMTNNTNKVCAQLSCTDPQASHGHIFTKGQFSLERTHLTNCEHLQIHLYSFDDFMAQNSLLLRVHEMTWYYNFDFWIWILERKSKLKPF